MIPTPTPPPPSEPARRYCIRVKGLLSLADWAGWFDDMTLKTDPVREETCLEGPVADQSELFGLLSRLRNLGLALISLDRVDES